MREEREERDRELDVGVFTKSTVMVSSRQQAKREMQIEWEEEREGWGS